MKVFNDSVGKSEIEEQKHELEDINHSMDENNNSKSIISKAELDNGSTKSKSTEVSLVGRMKQSKEQSQKFFYQQFLDSSDILAALVIVLLLRTLDDNMVSDLDKNQFLLFIYESLTKLVLEFIFTLVTPILVVRYSILSDSDFGPIKHSLKSFMANLSYFTISSLLIYPLFIYISFNLSDAH